MSTFNGYVSIQFYSIKVKEFLTVAIKSLVQSSRGFMALSEDGEFYGNASYSAIGKFIGLDQPLVCYKKSFNNPLPQNTLDVLELFAFVHPGKFCIPSIRGLCNFLKISEPVNSYEENERLFIILDTLLNQASQDDTCYNIAKHMAGAGWTFGSMILSRFENRTPPSPTVMLWNYLDDIKMVPPTLTGGQNQQVSAQEVKDGLKTFLENKKQTELRDAQYNYAEFTRGIFEPLATSSEINLLLSEAGTGVGKTLGYLAPAYLWAKKNNSSVWISTYTKALQNQVYKELDTIFPTLEEKKKNVTIRKGRENYICLLNFEEALRKITPNYILLVGLIARYIYKTDDGDLNGPDFPGWIEDLVGYEALDSICDKRGECIYSSCPYYKKCFIEKVINKAKDSKIVITNHALLMNLAQKDKEDNDTMPFHYIFDEGHHIFNAADNAFSASLSVLECYEMRRWVLGPENKKSNSRLKGLKRRFEDLIAIYPKITNNIDELCLGFAKFPKYGTISRIKKGETMGLMEYFFERCYGHIKANSFDKSTSYSQQADTTVTADFLDTSEEICLFLQDLKTLASKTANELEYTLEKNIKDLDANQKSRLENAIKSLKNRIVNPLTVWVTMLESLKGNPPQGYIDFFEIIRNEEIDIDIAYNRHFVDPTVPFALSMRNIAKGMMITSATLNDSKDSKNWDFANERTGANHFETTPKYFQAPSPFPYKEQSKVIIINDVNRNDIKQVSSAYRELFLASGGGALGIFTAISRLKMVYKNCKDTFLTQGIKLFSQHIDDINTSSLIDMFKYDEHSCLFGTDAIRDGIDIPGNSLKLIVFERVPWQRADILHRTRKAQTTDKNAYDCSLARAKMEQGFGRLIRKKDDYGTFIILEKATPSALLTAFPEGVPVMRISLTEALKIIKDN